MPGSPSFPSSETRGRWKKRKREPQNPKKPKPEDEDDDDDEELQQEEDEAPHTVPQSVHAAAAHAPRESEVLSGGGSRISSFPAAVRHTVNRPHSSVLAMVALERAIQWGDAKNQATNPVCLENISYGQLQALSAVPADSAALSTGEHDRADGGACAAAYVITPPQIMEGRGVVKRFGNNRLLVLPMHADWFSPNAVHRLERQVVPHFFSGKSPDHTPERYKDCRNWIVSKYMEKPEKRLFASDCQGVVSGVDIADLTRIFQFLEHWGIVNYCATAPNHEPWNSASYLREDTNGEVHVPSTALKSKESLVQFDRPKCRLKAADAYPSISCHGDDITDLDRRIRERLSEHRCNHCSQPIPAVYYQSQKEVDVLLCSDCFHEGRFVVGHSSIDFMRTESAKDYGDVDGETWNDQETLLLLEAMEIYNDNWNEIAEHVGSKSKAQCILHFIRLPMDDGLMENIEVPGMSTTNSSIREGIGRSHLTSNGDSAESCPQDHDFRLPFANSGNPVMSLVAFLASGIGPRVAAACAHASLAVLSEDDPLAASGNIMQMEGSERGSRMNKETACSKEVGTYGDATNSSHERAQSSRDQNDGEAAPVSTEKVQLAAKAGLSAAAMKAKLFADHEEREIQRLSANIINHQLKRLELKLKQFAEVETLLMKECEQVERARQRFAAERARVMSTRFSPSGISSPPSLPGAAPTVVNNSTSGSNSSRQHVSASTSQPAASGFSNSQAVHPHMSSFMPRQPMFGLGPRLPLAAINPSSSTPSSVLFSPPGNTNPALSHPMLRPVPGTSSGLG